MTINGIIERKLRLLEQKLSEINDWQITSYAEFRQSSLKINAVERALTVCVEIMIDISERILALKKIPPKDTSVENFKELERLKIIQSFETYADMIRFRNFIVHRYETIDTQILFAIVTKKCRTSDHLQMKSGTRQLVENLKAEAGKLIQTHKAEMGTVCELLRAPTRV